MVYVVDDTGEAVTIAAVLLDKPVVGCQVYDVAPLLLSVVALPEHKLVPDEPVNVKFGETKILMVFVEEHPLLLPVTV